ncbi:hypothetical protein N0V87_002072 [Didymella glomerata]|jgi:hypothetical protein|uniref:Uncharacterized protein n=1 Tax=Didymella glomerata TaxID=749621 RepID=A0A9W8X4Q0_9PLEO|nr:hypothetical protein N0V87_002072 [Didymella glomerata]
MTRKASHVEFLNLPVSIREKIYGYLLLPHLEEDVTTINYTLDWPHLENPSNTTFAGPTQIDLCTCSCDVARDDNGEDASDSTEELVEHLDTVQRQHEPHVYTRHQCSGPEVQFKAPHEGLWVLDAAHGQFNILRPATAGELADRPSAALLRTCRQVHDEALPYLYRDRDFFFLTGPCPRGRYQAYATLRWLQQLSLEARGNVEIISLLVQPYEEDCNIAEVEDAWAELGEYVRDHLPRFKWLCLDVWDQEVYYAANVFHELFDKQGVGIVVRQPQQGDGVEVFIARESFLASFEDEAE